MTEQTFKGPNGLPPIFTVNIRQYTPEEHSTLFRIPAPPERYGGRSAVVDAHSRSVKRTGKAAWAAPLFDPRISKAGEPGSLEQPVISVRW